MKAGVIQRIAWCFAVFCAAALISSLPRSYADDHASSSEPSAQTAYPNWMSWLPDSTPLSQISFPSTHDSMAHFGGPIVQTQSMPLGDQFRAGIRALDIRCRHSGNSFLAYHGVIFQFATFSDILRACNGFLEQNPSETILLWLGADGVPDPVDNTEDYFQTFLDYRNDSVLGARISTTIVGNRYNAPLGEARGKIVIIENFPCEYCDPKEYVTYPNCGLNGHGSSIMNRANGSTVLASSSSMNSYWGAIEDQFEFIDGDSPGFMDQNSLAGSGGVYPIDVANGFLGIDGMNSRALQYLFGGNQTRTTGLLWMDFPGPALISAVIAENLKFATNISLIANDFENIFEQVSWAATGDGDDESADHATELKNYLGHILPEQHWSVLVSATPGGDNWGFSVEPEGLYRKTDWIDGYSHVAINAQRLNADITGADIASYLTFSVLQSLSGDAVARASGVRSLLSAHFPWAHWNAAVKRVPADSDHWATVLDASASFSLPVPDDGEIYLYTVWASSGINRAPVANAGGPYEADEGSTVTFNASASSDPDGDTLQYRWDFNGDGVWDTDRSSDPAAAAIFPDDGSPPARLEVFDGALATVGEVFVKVHNVPPAVDAGGPAIVGKNLTLARECHIVDPGADTWTVEVTYGDGGSFHSTLRDPERTFQLQHTFTAAGDYDVRISVRDDDGGSGAATFHVQAGNAPPTPADDVIEIGSVTAGTEIKLNILKLLHNDTDPDSDPLTLKSFDVLSADQQSVRRDGDALFYRVPLVPVSDSFKYTVTDAGGAAGSATVHLVPVESNPASSLIALTRLQNGTTRVVFAGVAGRSYVIQASDTLYKPDWMILGTLAAQANGLLTFEDSDAANHLTRFYRTVSVEKSISKQP